jgi:heterodisulfide reductase subunit B
VAPFYGCQILRPSKLLGFEGPDRPWSLEESELTFKRHVVSMAPVIEKLEV